MRQPYPMQEGKGFEELAGEGPDQGDGEACEDEEKEATSVRVVFDDVEQTFAQDFEHDGIVFVGVAFEREVVHEMHTTRCPTSVQLLHAFQDLSLNPS